VAQQRYAFELGADSCVGGQAGHTPSLLTSTS
jgi:hypothetical protein